MQSTTSESNSRTWGIRAYQLNCFVYPQLNSESETALGHNPWELFIKIKIHECSLFSDRVFLCVLCPITHQVNQADRNLRDLTISDSPDAEFKLHTTTPS